MEKYKNAHKWLIIPFVITILGFTNSYFLNFFNARWSHHLHGLSSAAWFLFIIYQPYLATRGRLRDHKKNGIFGVFLAGMVVASAAVLIPNNIASAALENSANHPIAPTFFRYGVSFFDLVAITGFGVSVIIAIARSRNLDDHAIWMISTVFWALMPALARLALVPLLMTGNVTNFANIAMAVTPLILISIVILMVWLKRAHPALIAAFIGNLTTYLIKPLGHSEWWMKTADAIFK